MIRVAVSTLQRWDNEGKPPADIRLLKGIEEII